MIDILQILFILAFILGIFQGFYKLKGTYFDNVKEPDIYFIITDIFHK